jgi:hypothetical protein
MTAEILSLFAHPNYMQNFLPIRVTIAWYDAPSQRGSYAKALINDIDLLVVGDDGKRLVPLFVLSVISCIVFTILHSSC